jgi:hypothetical protein
MSRQRSTARVISISAKAAVPSATGRRIAALAGALRELLVDVPRIVEAGARRLPIERAHVAMPEQIVLGESRYGESGAHGNDRCKPGETGSDRHVILLYEVLTEAVRSFKS